MRTSPAWSRRNSGADLDAIFDALTRGGYRYGAVVIDAKLFVPHSRPRLFIVAVDTALDIPASLSASPPSPFTRAG